MRSVTLVALALCQALTCAKITTEEAAAAMADGDAALVDQFRRDLRTKPQLRKIAGGSRWQEAAAAER